MSREQVTYIDTKLPVRLIHIYEKGKVKDGNGTDTIKFDFIIIGLAVRPLY